MDSWPDSLTMPGPVTSHINPELPDANPLSCRLPLTGDRCLLGHISTISMKLERKFPGKSARNQWNGRHGIESNWPNKKSKCPHGQYCFSNQPNSISEINQPIAAVAAAVEESKIPSWDRPELQTRRTSGGREEGGGRGRGRGVRAEAGNPLRAASSAVNKQNPHFPNANILHFQLVNSSQQTNRTNAQRRSIAFMGSNAR